MGLNVDPGKAKAAGIPNELVLPQVKDALKALVRLGHQDPGRPDSFAVKAASGPLGPIDAAAPDRSELRDPRLLGGSRPFRRWHWAAS